MKLKSFQDTNQHLCSSGAISTHSHVKITQYWFSFPVMIEKDKNELHSYGNKINLDKILFFFRTNQENAVELNSRDKNYFRK